MQPRTRLTTVYLVPAGVLFIGVMLLQGYLWPPPKPPKKPSEPETVGLYAGAAATAGMDEDVLAKASAERLAQGPSVVGTLAGAAAPVSKEAGILDAVEAERREALA